MKTIYICEDSVTGMLSAIYDAWMESRDKESGIGLKEHLEQQLFCEYKEVQISEQKAKSVVRLIRNHLGDETYRDFYQTLLSEDPEKADAVFRVMRCARSVKNSRKIMEHLSNPAVAKVFSLSRKVENEAHRFLEFVRFRELENDVLFSEIKPQNRILSCIADHFADRFPLEDWMIYDKRHEEFVVHRAHYHWVMVKGEAWNQEWCERISDSEKEFARLWAGFFESISIPERENRKCQMNHLPLRYRKEMTEFKEKADFEKSS